MPYCYTSLLYEGSDRDQHVTKINCMRNQNVTVDCIVSGWGAGFFVNKEICC
jgi:hypothetical protein